MRWTWLIRLQCSLHSLRMGILPGQSVETKAFTWEAVPSRGGSSSSSSSCAGGASEGGRAWLGTLPTLLASPGLPFHPVMNSINLNLFKASVGETTAFVVVSAVHSRTVCLTWSGPQLLPEGQDSPPAFSLAQRQQQF